MAGLEQKLVQVWTGRSDDGEFKNGPVSAGWKQPVAGWKQPIGWGTTRCGWVKIRTGERHPVLTCEFF